MVISLKSVEQLTQVIGKKFQFLKETFDSIGVCLDKKFKQHSRIFIYKIRGTFTSRC